MIANMYVIYQGQNCVLKTAGDLKQDVFTGYTSPVVATS